MATPNQDDPSIMSSKRDEAAAEAALAAQSGEPSTAGPAVDAPPAYEPVGEPSSHVAPEAVPAAEAAPGSSQHNQQGPSINDPFNFPIDAPLPPYSPPEDKKKRYIVAPQVTPDLAAAFLPIYAPRLMSYGITEETWLAFLDTLSAFLTAKVSDRAIAHAGDVAKEVGQDTVRPFKEVISHTKHVGKHIGHTAKRGDVVGAVFGAVGGAVSIPVTAAMGLVTAALQLPGSAISAASKTPQSQRARAEAYITVANRDWFAARGLGAELVDTRELSRRLGESVVNLFKLPQAIKAVDAHEQLKVLAGKVAEVEVWATSPKIEVKESNLWLVLIEKEGDVMY